jgi:hypothetical protein
LTFPLPAEPLKRSGEKDGCHPRPCLHDRRVSQGGLDQVKGKSPASNKKAGLQQREEPHAMIERLKRERDQLRRG